MCLKTTICRFACISHPHDNDKEQCCSICRDVHVCSLNAHSMEGGILDESWVSAHNYQITIIHSFNVSICLAQMSFTFPRHHLCMYPWLLFFPVPRDCKWSKEKTRWEWHLCDACQHKCVWQEHHQTTHNTIKSRVKSVMYGLCVVSLWMVLGTVDCCCFVFLWSSDGSFVVIQPSMRFCACLHSARVLLPTCADFMHSFLRAWWRGPMLWEGSCVGRVSELMHNNRHPLNGMSISFTLMPSTPPNSVPLLDLNSNTKMQLIECNKRRVMLQNVLVNTCVSEESFTPHSTQCHHMQGPLAPHGLCVSSTTGHCHLLLNSPCVQHWGWHCSSTLPMKWFACLNF